MPTFPIPIFVACVLVFATVRLWHQQRRVTPLMLMLMLCAAQSLIIALNQHYGVPGTRLIQPVVAAFIPPAAWIAFQVRVQGADSLHLLGPLAAWVALLIAPQFIDALLPGLFAVYGGAILYRARAGADTQPNALLSSGDLPSRIWVVIGAALIASALSDLLIVAAQTAGNPGLKPWIISLFSVGNLLLIGILSLSPHLHTEDDTASDAQTPPAPDAETWKTVQAYMAKHRPYLDPDLTLSRLSRKLGVPAKVLSSTINLATGNNVSRFINEARIKAAQRSMLGGESVTNAMLTPGFNTKSNFNREFLRVVGKSPTVWLNDQERTKGRP